MKEFPGTPSGLPTLHSANCFAVGIASEVLGSAAAALPPFALSGLALALGS
eukprot:CAMPEP_0170632656 /NCGR_PEP_ID=MMETSP0224-20130122/35452_1 /TAXON_ID=285029 /ORGANISM="Togula jolla, Strain CCCM 725" /LENGTH=50 /DNA_ID=CAMNT_0010961399 /DNA_START=131 /DNA_END=279 /DNA_ORIENTATION=-